MSFDIINRIENASLSGFALMFVMLACFFVGALSMRLAIEFDAKALWAAIRRNKPAEERDEDAKGEA